MSLCNYYNNSWWGWGYEKTKISSTLCLKLGDRDIGVHLLVFLLLYIFEVLLNKKFQILT
jgi:hypothetical protein